RLPLVSSSRLLRPRPRSTLFPYTTLFRSHTDLTGGVEAVEVLRVAAVGGARPAVPGCRVTGADDNGVGFRVETRALPRRTAALRSEEHTSELQSRENLVCRLLLEKKKINK